MNVFGIFWDSHIFGVDDKKASMPNCGSISHLLLTGRYSQTTLPHAPAIHLDVESPSRKVAGSLVDG